MEFDDLKKKQKQTLNLVGTPDYGIVQHTYKTETVNPDGRTKVAETKTFYSVVCLF